MCQSQEYSDEIEKFMMKIFVKSGISSTVREQQSL